MRTIRRIVIMGAAGRDFHNFNVRFRDDPACEVVAFTASQIPNIDGRTYPPELAGARYPRGIPIFDESELPALVRRLDVSEAVFSYSDVSHMEVMHRASLVNALGADFCLLGTQSTMLASSRPVISVCAVRTGCGKSQTARRIAGILRNRGFSVVVVRHPMPYGADLNRQRCQRFVTLEDLDRHQCTIEEREEYEAHIGMGNVVFAGVDYGQILRQAEAEADVILWDGGNNDLPFYRPDLHIVLVDPHRPGHEIAYHPGETNLRMAQVVIVAKSGSAAPAGIDQVVSNVKEVNPDAALVRADSIVDVDDGEAIRGRRVLVVEDGPTLTHGGMSYGAAHVVARRFGASEIVDPRPYATGSIREVFAQYPHLVDVLPAMGYSEGQVRELEETINAVPCDLVLVGTPFDLTRLVRIRRPALRVTYHLDDRASAALESILNDFMARRSLNARP